MTRPVCVLPDGCESKKEFLLRLFSIGWGDKHTPKQIVERIKKEHNLSISQTMVLKTRNGYNQSLNKKSPRFARGRPPVHVNGSISPVEIVQQFALSVKACGGLIQARLLLDLLEGGIS